MSEQLSDKMPDRQPKKMSECRIESQIESQIVCQIRCQSQYARDSMSEYVFDRLPDRQIARQIARKYAKRMSDRRPFIQSVRQNATIRVRQNPQKDWQNICQILSESECRYLCQDTCGGGDHTKHFFLYFVRILCRVLRN